MSKQNEGMNFIDVLKATGNFVDYASEQKNAWDEATKDINEKLIMGDEGETKVMTKEEFIKELESKEAGTTYNVESVDSGAIRLSMGKCTVTVNLEYGIEGEIIIFKPYTEMEVSIDFYIVDEIVKEDDGSFILEFNNGTPDITIIPILKKNE